VFPNRFAGRARGPGVVTRWTYVGLALLAVGLSSAGAGAATHVDEQQCRSTQHVSVAAVNDSASTRANVTAYGNLSATEREVFAQALEARGGLLTSRGAIDSGRVRYQNRTYAVRVTREGDCTPYHPRRVLLPAVGGLALVGAGLVLTRGRGG
jgi:hypothetical protein